IDQAMAELKVAAFSAAVGQEQRAALFSKTLRDRLALGSGGLAVNHKDGRIGGTEVFGEGGLRAQKLRENDRSAFSFRQRQEQITVFLPIRSRRVLCTPVNVGRLVGVSVQGMLPRGWHSGWII